MLSLCISFAQNEKISFNETVHDFGVIGFKDGKVSCNFVITNKSDAPLVISDVKASCGCTTPSWTKEPIEPGKSGTITAVYNPTGVAPFSKSVTVYTNLSNPVTLHIKGEVVNGVSVNGIQLPSKDYVEALGDYALKTKTLDFGRVGAGELKTFRLDVFNKSDKPITQKVQKLPKYITVNFSEAAVPAKKEAVVEVTLDTKIAGLYGNLQGEINLLLNGVSYAFPYSATILDDFEKWLPEKRVNSGRINANFTQIDFGNFSKGYSRTIKLSNSGKTKLNIRNIQLSNPLITVSKKQFSVNPGEIEGVTITIDKAIVKSALSSTLTIVSDDPSTPLYDVAITAKP
ncbi:MAG: DUF1573 domain-containing protein [Candidatus Symbiothrix sp.]|jgi:hypothetical protein|nr:DUF1573 domain-containing protein [Candidatus Symbiothrix sp.]